MLSRVADTLYWMSRYLERGEHTARLLDLQLHLMIELDESALEQRWDRLLISLHMPKPPNGQSDAFTMTHWITFDPENQNSLVSCIAAARENARHVREEISSEMWEQVNLLYLQVQAAEIETIWDDQPHVFFRSVKEGVHLFQGITDSTMNHGEGWQFIQLARALERVSATALLLKAHFEPNIRYHDPITTDYLEWVSLLKSCTAFEAYCKVYTAELRPDRIAEFLILNSDFPHSIRFSVDAIHAALQSITQATENKRARQVNRLAGRLRATLDFGQIDEIVGSGLHGYLDSIQSECVRIHDAIYQAYITYPIDELVS